MREERKQAPSGQITQAGNMDATLYQVDEEDAGGLATTQELLSDIYKMGTIEDRGTAQ
ncbi:MULTISPECIES: hypothetical protein [Brevibacillus]|jgi:hypothetical protein|uniref:hypothetical protein n=1 Tax=Brevibacillus TaxID=55080 RepID=UPI001C22B95B|nr:hypothetical protein [Brevibacillus parabrevis]MBU8711501.1 hypothetical protein [Brevibacillus parabrevis]MDR4999324.1 hypothetical protein [Brevibacillus parabrevis]WDV93327.1 hypothetical protein PSE45_16860 [Brevibacillus parabrevis]